MSRATLAYLPSYLRPFLLLLSLPALGLAGAAGCMAYNEPCTAFVDDPEAVVGYLEEEISIREAEVRVEDAAIGQLVADAYVRAFDGTDEPADVGIENAGAIRDEGLCEPRESLAAGPVRKKVLREILPFDDTVELVEITEQGLKDLFEHAYARLGTLEPASGAFLQLGGAEVAVDCGRPAEVLSDEGRVRTGERVVGIVLRPRTQQSCTSISNCTDARYPDCAAGLVSLRDPTQSAAFCGRVVDPSAPDPAGRVRVATNSFLSGGGDGYLDFAEPTTSTVVGRSDALNFQIVAAWFAAAWPEESPYPGLPEDRVVLLNCD